MTVKLATEFRTWQIDLEAVLENHWSAKMRFFLSSPERRQETLFDLYFPNGLRPPLLENVESNAIDCDELFMDISIVVNSIRASYLAPAMQFQSIC